MKTITNKYNTSSDGAGGLIVWPTNEFGWNVQPMFRGTTPEPVIAQDVRGKFIRAGYEVTQLDSEGYPISETEMVKTLVDVVAIIAA